MVWMFIRLLAAAGRLKVRAGVPGLDKQRRERARGSAAAKTSPRTEFVYKQMTPPAL